MRIVDGGVAEQTKQCLRNIEEVLALVGASLADVVKTTIYLADMGDFATMNTVYGEAFGERKPSRTTVAVAGLPLQACIEIEAIAVAPAV